MTTPKTTDSAEFDENAFVKDAVKLIGEQAQWSQSGERIDPIADPDIGWSYQVQRMRDCRKGAMWMHAQMAEQLANLNAEIDGLRNILHIRETERDSFLKDINILKQQLSWNLQNNDEFGCEFVGIVILKQELNKLQAEVDEQCRLNGMGQERELKLMTELKATREMCERLVSAIDKFWKGSKGCDPHDFEPNTTMDYFRCEKCGIPAAISEALAAYEELVNSIGIK